jgi:hypothetical protein
MGTTADRIAQDHHGASTRCGRHFHCKEQSRNNGRSLLQPAVCIAMLACAGAACVRATKNPARHPARAAGVASVNTLFWKILVTRVKRKVLTWIAAALLRL